MNKVHPKCVVNPSLIGKLCLTIACSTLHACGPQQHLLHLYIKLFQQVSPLGFSILFIMDSTTGTSVVLSLSLSDELGDYFNLICVFIYCSTSLFHLNN